MLLDAFTGSAKLSTKWPIRSNTRRRTVEDFGSSAEELLLAAEELFGFLEDGGETIAFNIYQVVVLIDNRNDFLARDNRLAIATFNKIKFQFQRNDVDGRRDARIPVEAVCGERDRINLRLTRPQILFQIGMKKVHHNLLRNDPRMDGYGREEQGENEREKLFHINLFR